jgi:hypothetical protein
LRGKEIRKRFEFAWLQGKRNSGAFYGRPGGFQPGKPLESALGVVVFDVEKGFFPSEPSLMESRIQNAQGPPSRRFGRQAFIRKQR